MANELTTKLNLDIRPFLDAIKRAANAVSNIVEIKPQFDSTEFRNLQTQIKNFKPAVNVAVNVDKRSLDAVANEINLIGIDPLNIEVLINSEEIQTSVERIRELRATALNIPAKTDAKIDTNADSINKEFTKVKKTVDSIEGEYTIQVDSNEPEVTKQIDLIQSNIKTLTSEDYEIVLDVDTEALQKSLADIPSFIRPLDIPIDEEIFVRINQEIKNLSNNFETFRKQLAQTDIGAQIAEGADVGDLITESNVNQVERVIQLLNDVEDNRDITLDFNDEELALAVGIIRDEFEKFGIILSDIDNIQFDNESIKRYAIAIFDAQNNVKLLNDELTAVNKQKLGDIFPGIEKSYRGLLDSASRLGDIRLGIEAIEERARTAGIIDFKVDENAKKEILDVANTIKEIPTVRDIFIDIINEESQNKINDFSKELNDIPNQKNTKVNVQDVPESINELNQVQKEVNDIPNQKNVKINVDATGASKASQTVSGVTGFVGQLGSGLLASFSGAAIGAAIANFATQSVRAIVQASDKADELNDKLKLAFTQAGQGISGFQLDTQLQNANVFALDLGNNFGISIARSKELLAQVVGLTGEFGTTSEAITKASIGIEEATGGLVKAETAAKLFSRSIGNPEDQAALETLAKRFPAIGEAIKGATDPAEKANAVLSNLTGTFESLEEKSRGFGEQFQLLSEVSFGAFATAIVPIFDAFVPILENLRKVITENAGAFEDFSNRVVTGFIEPLVNQLIEAGPEISEFGASLFDLFSISSKISFASLQLGVELLAQAFSLLSAVIEPFKPILDGLADSFRTALGSITGAFGGELESVNELVSQFSFGLLDAKDSVQGLNPVFDRLKSGFTVIEPIVKSLGDNISNFLIPAFAALKVAIEALFLPLRLYNFLAEQASGLSKTLSFDIDSLGVTIAKLSVFFTPLLQIANVIKNIRGQRLNAQELGADIGAVGNQLTGLTKNIGSVVTGFSLLSQGVKKVNIDNLGGGGGGGGINKANKDLKETLSILEQQLNAYDELAKRVESRYNLELSLLDLSQKKRTAELGRQLNENEKLAFGIQKVNLLTQQQNELQKALATQFGISADSIKELAQGFLQTGNLANIPIKINGQNITFDAKDPKTVESFKKVADLLIKTLDNSIKLEAEQQEIKIGIAPTVELQSETVISNLDALETSVRNKLLQLEFGKLPLEGFDVNAIRQQYETIRSTSQNALEGLRTQLKTTTTSIAETESKLKDLANAGKQNSDESIALNNELGALKEQYKLVSDEIDNYNGAVQVAEERTANLGQTVERTASQSFERLLERQSFQLQLDLNAEGLQQGLIEVELDYFRRLKTIENEGRLALKRLETEGASTETLKKVADAQARVTADIRAQRLIAIREFKKENDAVFAIVESLRKNLSDALNPDTTEADNRLKKRKEELNSELELLRANLDIEQELNENNLAQRNLSYQEYNAKLLELEKEKADAIKEYDKEVEQAKLDGYKRIADEALPGITKQLELESAKLTDMIQKGTATFDDYATKGLETLALISAQSIGLALQNAKSLEDIQKLFFKTLIKGVLRELQAQLYAAILQGIFEDVKKAGTLGLLTGALLSGALTALFAKAEQQILALAGYEKGGYTGDNYGTKEVAGVVHGQEYVVNAKATKQNKGALDWVNKTGKTFEEYVAKTQKGVLSGDKFSVLNEQVLRNFDTRMNNLELKVNDKSTLNIQNYVDTKSIGASVNQLAYTMDSRLSSLETTVDKAIRQNATLTRSANQLDVSVYSDPGTTIKHMRKIGKIKGLS